MNAPPFRVVSSLRIHAIGIALCVSLALPRIILGVDIDVTSSADSGAGSLREALTTAADGDVIVFDIADPAPVITLAGPLPALAVDVSFRNDMVDPVTIERSGNAAWDFSATIDPTGLTFVNGGVASADADILASSTSTLFGDGVLSGNLTTEGTIAPGASETAGSIGTFEVTGDLDGSDATFEIDLDSAGGGISDLVQVGGTLTLTDATLNPNFVSEDLEAGQSFTIASAGSITGTFSNLGTPIALPGQPFLEAVPDGALPANQFGLSIQDNGITFESLVSGDNQTSAAILLDELLALGTVVGVNELRNGSTDGVNLAIAQLSGSIYPSLIGAEINHVQTNLASVRDRVALHGLCSEGLQKAFWSRGYGSISNAAGERSQTAGYRHEVGGLELGGGLRSSNGLAAYGFAHLAESQLRMRESDHSADVTSYRVGGLVEFRNDRFYALAAGGSGTQEYDVRRTLSAFQGSTFAESQFDGTSDFGYAEFGSYHLHNMCVWGPYAGVYATRVALDPITESGDAEFALTNGGGTGESFRSVLGVSIAKSANTSLGMATTRIRAGWMHEFSDEFQIFESRLATPTINSLVDRGVSSGENWAFIRAQTDMGTFLGAQITASYLGQYNSRIAMSTGMLGLYWEF